MERIGSIILVLLEAASNKTKGLNSVPPAGEPGIDTAGFCPIREMLWVLQKLCFVLGFYFEGCHSFLYRQTNIAPLK